MPDIQDRFRISILSKALNPIYNSIQRIYFPAGNAILWQVVSNPSSLWIEVVLGISVFTSTKKWGMQGIFEIPQRETFRGQSNKRDCTKLTSHLQNGICHLNWQWNAIKYSLTNKIYWCFRLFCRCGFGNNIIAHHTNALLFWDVIPPNFTGGGKQGTRNRLFPLMHFKNVGEGIRGASTCSQKPVANSTVRCVFRNIFSYSFTFFKNGFSH